MLVEGAGGGSECAPVNVSVSVPVSVQRCVLHLRVTIF